VKKSTPGREEGDKYEELNMKKTLHVPFRAILCPACCNFPANLNTLFVDANADTYVEAHNNIYTTKKKITEKSPEAALFP
jgi:hypothetical protein